MEEEEIAKLNNEISSLSNQIDILFESERAHLETISTLEKTIVELSENVSKAEENLLVCMRAKSDVEFNLSRANDSICALENTVEEHRKECHDLRLQVEALTNQLAADRMETYREDSPDINLSSLSMHTGSSGILAKTKAFSNPNSHKSNFQQKRAGVVSPTSDNYDRDRTGSMISIDLEDDVKSVAESGMCPSGEKVKAVSLSKADLTSEDVKGHSNLMAVNEVKIPPGSYLFSYMFIFIF